MNWTELSNYKPLTDVKKFVKYASENKLVSSETINSDSFFCDASESREHVLGNIMYYDFFEINKIEELFGKTLKISQLSNIDVLLRITAAAMLKNKPAETGLRERNKEGADVNHRVDWMPTGTDMKNNAERTPPQFYYPM